MIWQATAQLMLIVQGCVTSKQLELRVALAEGGSHLDRHKGLTAMKVYSSVLYRLASKSFKRVLF